MDSSSIIFYFEKEKATSLAKKKRRQQGGVCNFISTQIPSFQTIWISAWKIKSFHMEPQFKHVGVRDRAPGPFYECWAKPT